MVTFPQAIRLFFARYTDFQGRSRRSEYWWVVLLNILVAITGGFLIGLLGGFDGTGSLNPAGMALAAILVIYALAIIIPSIALFVRRLHDINQTGWIALGIYVASVVPIIGLLASVAQIVIGVLPGTAGDNKYGPDPKGPATATQDVFV